MRNHVLTSQYGEMLVFCNTSVKDTFGFEALMCGRGFLFFFQHPLIWQGLFEETKNDSVHTQSFAHTFPKDVKPLSHIPLLGCVIEERPLELHQCPGFCLTQAKTAHTFSWESSDFKDGWMAVLKAVVTGRVSEYDRQSFVVNTQYDVQNGQVLYGDKC